MPRKKFPVTDEEYQVRLRKFLENIENESDRGCVLVAVAIIDENLEILLRSQLLQSEPKILNLLFSGQGPLNSFWSKIQLTRAMDLIPGWMYEDLEHIRTLRNIFAHRYDSADFSDADVIFLTTKLEGANYAVVAIEKNKKVSELVLENDEQPQKGRSVSQDSDKVVKKERFRFTLTSSYIGGWLEAEVKIRALKKEISERKIHIEALKKETERLEIEESSLKNEISELDSSSKDTQQQI